MKKEYQENFFKPNKVDSAEEVHAKNIKSLKDSILLGRQNIEIGERTTWKIYGQDQSLIQGRKDLVKMNKPLKKAEESMTNMEDACRCTIL